MSEGVCLLFNFKKKRKKKRNEAPLLCICLFIFIFSVFIYKEDKLIIQNTENTVKAWDKPYSKPIQIQFN